MRKRKYVKQVGVTFDKNYYELLIETTDREEVSISEFIRTLVEKELRKGGTKS